MRRIRKKCAKSKETMNAHRRVVKKEKLPTAFFTFSDPANIHLPTVFLRFCRERFLVFFSSQKFASHRLLFTILPRRFWTPFFGAKRRKNLLGIFSSARSAEKPSGPFLAFFTFLHFYGFVQLHFLVPFFFMIVSKKVFYSPAIAKRLQQVLLFTRENDALFALL